MGAWKSVNIAVTSTYTGERLDNSLLFEHSYTPDATHSNIGFGAGTGGAFCTFGFRNAVVHPGGLASVIGVPVAGDSGKIAIENLLANSFGLRWRAASDSNNFQDTIQYLVYYSTSPNMSTVADIEANGIAVGSYASGIVTKNITGLTAGITYYANLVAKNSAGFKTAYSMKTVTTPMVIDPSNLQAYTLFDAYSREAQVQDTITSYNGKSNNRIQLVHALSEYSHIQAWYSQMVKVPFTVTYEGSVGNDCLGFEFGKNISAFNNHNLGYTYTPSTTTDWYNAWQCTGNLIIQNANGTNLSSTAKTLSQWATTTIQVTATQIILTHNGTSTSANHSYTTGDDVYIGFNGGMWNEGKGINEIRNVMFTQQ